MATDTTSVGLRLLSALDQPSWSALLLTIDEAATWTAFRPGPVHLSTSTATARVLSVADVILITGFDPGT